jgi:hypothetical protein
MQIVMKAVGRFLLYIEEAFQLLFSLESESR